MMIILFTAFFLLLSLSADLSTMDAILNLMCLELTIYLYALTFLWFHLMMILMILELFMLKLYFMSVAFLSPGPGSFFSFLFISLSVAEASVALGLLTMLVRLHGNDYMSSISI